MRRPARLLRLRSRCILIPGAKPGHRGRKHAAGRARETWNHVLHYIGKRFDDQILVGADNRETQA